MKKLFALLLSLCLLAGVSAVQAEAGLIFPWHGYTLEVSLAALAQNDSPFSTPPEGALVRVRFTSLGAPVAKEDIKSFAGDFSIRDGNGDEWRWYSHSTSSEAKPAGSDKEEYTYFEMEFVLRGKPDSAFEGAQLLVAGENEGERIVIDLDNAPRELAQKPSEAAPTPTAAPAEASDPDQLSLSDSFEWHGYTVKVDSIITDTDEMKLRNTPTDGAVVLLRFACLSGAIPRSELDVYVDDFVLEAGDGSTRGWRIFRTSSKDAAEGSEDDYLFFEVVFVLTNKTLDALPGSKLHVSDAEGGREIVVALDDTVPAPETIGSPERFVWRGTNLSIPYATTDVDRSDFTELPDAGALIEVRLQPLESPIYKEHIDNVQEVLLRTSNGQTWSYRRARLMHPFAEDKSDSEGYEYMTIAFYIKDQTNDVFEGAELVFPGGLVIPLDGLPSEMPSESSSDPQRGLTAGSTFVCNGLALKITGVEDGGVTGSKRRITVTVAGDGIELIIANMSDIHKEGSPRVFLVDPEYGAYPPVDYAGYTSKSNDFLQNATQEELDQADLTRMDLIFEVPAEYTADMLFLNCDGNNAVPVSAVPAELVGTWQGKGTPLNNGPAIDLEVTVNADGAGSYTFIQGDYRESSAITLSSSDQSFSVVPSNASTMIASCDGSYAYENGVLTLDITTTFLNGQTYRYTAECTRK